jgi:protein-S-isoprenylcysteine O-methyltransferase Ste14
LATPLTAGLRKTIITVSPRFAGEAGRVDEMKTIIKKVVGVVLIIVGLVALLTPLTPGSWLALIGLELLGVRLLIERKLLNEKQRAAIDKFMQKFKFVSGRQNNKANNKKG